MLIKGLVLTMAHFETKLLIVGPYEGELEGLDWSC